MKEIAIIGAGAAGYFCAANLKSANVKVHLFEQGQRVLKKVKISGGGRCNVTHNIFTEKLFASNYPRGQKELLSPFMQFQAKNTLQWFLKRGVKIVAESDGRMFPTTNDSQTVIDCLKKEAAKNKVNILLNHKVTQIEKTNNKFKLHFSNHSDLTVNKVLLCTGSSENGYKLAEQLGHKITDRAPSLFTFKVKHPVLKDLSGVSFKNSRLKLSFNSENKKFESEGPLLITHWGFSGPAILKLSAWAAREMKQENYKAKLTINFSSKNVQGEIAELKSRNANSNLVNAYPEYLSKRFWTHLINFSKISPEKKWSEINKKETNLLIKNLSALEFNVNGQNRFKEEFVECGGVSLKEVNFKTMQSKITPGLFFAGEILDIDGVTGGFNFQNAWTTSWITAKNIAL